MVWMTMIYARVWRCRKGGCGIIRSGGRANRLGWGLNSFVIVTRQHRVRWWRSESILNIGIVLWVVFGAAFILIWVILIVLQQKKHHFRPFGPFLCLVPPALSCMHIPLPTSTGNTTILSTPSEASTKFTKSGFDAVLLRVPCSLPPLPIPRPLPHRCLPGLLNLCHWLNLLWFRICQLFLLLFHCLLRLPYWLPFCFLFILFFRYRSQSGPFMSTVQSWIHASSKRDIKK